MDGPAPYRCIRCSNVPVDLLNKSEAKKYFQQYGHVAKLSLKSRHRFCLVEFDDEDGAHAAYTQAGEYHGEVFDVEWHKVSLVKKKKDPDLDWSMDRELEMELAAMGAEVPVKPEVKKERKTKAASSTVVKKKETKVNHDDLKLYNSLKQPGVTTEEKYRLLEARDKLARLRRRNRKAMDIAKVTKGTCPDMCSEKERLMREVQHQVGLYEQNADRSMNHSIAVKQYSRSSADQEAPLPHELRNVDVLQMTMGYLMHEIMDMCDAQDTNLAEWYHFLWDRTRGIRKDITQQELCCLGSVELVEQCARFHIHCSARLVAEDPSVFDHKINTENLTKCLQTLKYMYHDLDVKGVSCPNEAEFRAYVILLNLNDGNFMWEVQQLREDIKSSPQVRFALDVYSAIDKNNYVKFFKLVRSTTYLNACILLRYFIQVRLKALDTVIKCYSPRSKTLFPIDKLAVLLAFEGVRSTVDFFEYYGLQMNEDKTHVLLDRRSLTMPDFPYTLDRAMKVVESKRTRTVGEIVCGNKDLPFPSFRTHEPQCSFDEDGYLDISEFTMQEKQPIIPQVEESVEEMEEAPPSAKVTFSGFDAIRRDLERKNVNPQPLQPSADQSKPGGFVFALKPQLQPAVTLSKSPVAFNFLNHKQDLAKQSEMLLKRSIELEKQKKEAEKVQRALEEKKRIERELERMRQMEMDIIRRKEEQMRRKEEHMRRMEEEEEERRRRRLMEEEQETQRRLRRQREEEEKRLQREETERRKLLEIESTVRNVVEKMLQKVEESYRKHRLSELKCRYLQRRSLIKWRRRAAANKRKRKAVEQSPLWISQKTPSEAAIELRMKSQDFTLNLRKRYKLGMALEIATKQPKIVQRINLEPVQKLLITAFGKCQRPQSFLYWKVNVVNKTPMALDEYLALKNDLFFEQLTLNQTRITYCFHRVEEQLDYECHGHIFIAKRYDQIATQLRIFVQNLPLKTLLPIVLILEEDEGEKIMESIGNTLKVIRSKGNKLEYFDEALIFLAENVNPNPPLALNTLKGFLTDGLGAELWRRVSSFSKWNMAYKQCLNNVNLVVSLYNEGLRKLRCIALSEDCCEHIEFPSIFKDFLPSKIPDYLPCDYRYFPSFWKDSDYRRLLVEKFDELQLPEFDELEDGRDTEKWMAMYCESTFRDESRAFYRAMSCVLRDIDDGLTWVRVVEVLAAEKLNEINFELEQFTDTVFNQLFVVYDTVELGEFSKRAWFYLENECVKAEIDFSVNKIVEVQEDEVEDEEFDLEKTWNAVMLKDNDDADLKCRNDFRSFEYMMEDLEKSMAIQRQVSHKFQSALKNLLADDEA